MKTYEKSKLIPDLDGYLHQYAIDQVLADDRLNMS